MAYPNYAYPGASPFVSEIIRSTIPFVVANTGTMGNNGAVTLGTALNKAYPASYLFLPAGAIQTNSPAGWYFTIFSSTTVGQVFQNSYAAGVPPLPAAAALPGNIGGTLVPFVSTGPGAFTGTTGAVTGPTIQLPQNTMGPQSSLRFQAITSTNNSAGAKVASLLFGATTVSTFSATTSTGQRQDAFLSNQGTFKDQIVVTNDTDGTETLTRATNDTTTDLAIAATLNLAVATDTLTLEAFVVELLP
jgi:hypothetical protein